MKQLLLFEDKETTFIGFKCRLCPFEGVFEYGQHPKQRCPKCDSGFYTLIFFKNEATKDDLHPSHAHDNPRWSWSMGVNVEDIPKMNKLYPDRVYHPQTGQLLIKNRQEKKRYMKQSGFEEYN